MRGETPDARHRILANLGRRTHPLFLRDHGTGGLASPPPTRGTHGYVPGCPVAALIELAEGTRLVSHDFTPVHHDKAAAQAQGVQDVFMNILTTNGLVGRYVTDWAGPNAVLKRVAIKLGALEVGGRLPSNTHGGQLSEAYIHGVNGVNEGVRLIRGTSVNQPSKVDHVLVTAGVGVPTSAMILGRA